MKGHKFLKVTGILMIIAAVFSIIAGVLVGGLGVLAAGLGAESGLTFPYWAALFLLSIVMSLVNGGEFNVVSVLTGIAIPALYIYGAVLNSKADTQ